MKEYKNPRLKYVKKIKDLAEEMPYSSYTNEIIDKCNLLLETKKAKKRKKVCKETFDGKHRYSETYTEGRQYCLQCGKLSPYPKEESKCECLFADKGYHRLDCKLVKSQLDTPTPSRSEVATRLDDLIYEYDDEIDSKGLSKAILSKFILTPIK